MRVIREITIGNKKLRALFYPYSERSFIIRRLLPQSMHYDAISPFNVRIGNKKSRITERCIVLVSIEGMRFDVSPHVIDGFGGESFDMIIGATAMDEWGIKLSLKGELNLTSLKRRYFIEYRQGK